MIKIAFFITEIADFRTQALLEGATKRAKEKEAALIICPGRYLVSAGHRDTGLPDYYQETAVFDYISDMNADALIMDIGEIAKHASARKKEDFIEKYSFLPHILIDKITKGKQKSAAQQETQATQATKALTGEGTEPHQKKRQPGEEMITTEDDDFEKIGRDAVDKAITLVNTIYIINGIKEQRAASEIQKTVAAIKKSAKGKAETAKKKKTKQSEKVCKETKNPALLEESAHKFFHHSYQKDSNPYDMILERAAKFGAGYGALYLFPEAVIYTRENEWNIPGNMLILSLLQESVNVRLKEAIPVSVEDVIADAVTDDSAPYVCILNSLYLNDRQIGLMVTEFTPAFAEIYVNSLFMYMVTGAIRLISNDQQLIRTQDALIENKKRIEKDASVLERLGDEDYLTKKLNRRGFFSQAYDKLAKKFVEGTYAIVAYIDMDSIKSINAYFGREEGDHAVKRVAELLEQVFGKDCILGRIRGNEFAVLLVTRDDALSDTLREEMSKQNLRLMKDTSKPYIIHLQFSICAFKHKEGLSLKEMLSETDDNLQKIRQI